MHDLEYQPVEASPGEAPGRPLVMILFGMLAFVVGLGSYALFIAIRSRQWVGGNDFGVVVCYGLACYLTAAVPLWTGVLALARVALSQGGASNSTRLLTYVLLPPLVAAVPAALLVMAFGASLKHVLSPEGLTFLVMFISAGGTYGLGWHIGYGSGSSLNRQ